MTNPLGDLEITDPRAMRALAHPVRLAIMDRLIRHGAATATQLAPHVGATPSVVSWHLRHLAEFGLVRDGEPAGDRRQRRWEAAARGFRYETPEDVENTEGAAAAGVLTRQFFDKTAGEARRWADQVEPELDHEWRRLSGLSNTGMVVSAEELIAIRQGIEALLAPYVMRAADDRPEGSRRVRLVRYILPEAAPSEAVPPEAPDAQGERR
jgi:DNA-binding transcriptional ArsR family regulator